MIAGFPTGTICKEGARYVDHMGRALVLVDNRGTAPRAKAPRRPGRLILKAGQFRLAFGHAKAAAPAPDICCIGGAMHTPARTGMIMPSPSRRKIYFDLHCATKAPGRYRCGGCDLGLRCTLYFAHLGPFNLHALYPSFTHRTNRSADVQYPRFDGAIPRAQAWLTVCSGLQVADDARLRHRAAHATGVVDYGGDHQDRVVPPHV